MSLSVNLTSRFGSHESVCKPDQPDLGQVMVGRVGETGKVDQLAKVGTL